MQCWVVMVRYVNYYLEWAIGQLSQYLHLCRSVLEIKIDSGVHRPLVIGGLGDGVKSDNYTVLVSPIFMILARSSLMPILFA